MKQNLMIALILGVGLVGSVEKGVNTATYSTHTNEASLDIQDVTIDKSKLSYDRRKSLWSFNNHPYSGHAVSYYENGNPKEKIGIRNGRKHNLTIEWYADGHYKRHTNYHDGKLSGDKKSWSGDSSHVLLSHLQYAEGKLHGEQRKWYPTGELFKQLNFKMGKEDGLQQAYRKNGALFANYEAKNGRIFGLKKASLCFELSEETIITDE